MTLPAGGSIATVGGPGHEFDIGGIIYSECSPGQCTNGSSGTHDEGFGKETGFIASDPMAAPQQPGAWRIEESPSAASAEDWFLNVMLVTSNTDQNVVSTSPSTTLSGNDYVTTWKDNSDTCTYTVTLPKSGIGGTVKTTGPGCAVQL
jgi:hypothetical protein